MHCIELAIAPGIGIEANRVEAIRVADVERQPLEQTFALAAAVEIQIGRPRPGALVEDVERTVQIDYEEAIVIARLERSAFTRASNPSV